MLMKQKIPKGLKILPIAVLISVVGFLQSCGESDRVDFSSQIKPIFNNKCITCHGGVKQNGGFSLLFEKEATAVNESGKPAIVPGDASGSELITASTRPTPSCVCPTKNRHYPIKR